MLKLSLRFQGLCKSQSIRPMYSCWFTETKHCRGSHRFAYKLARKGQKARDVGESDCERREEKASCRGFVQCYDEINSETAKGPFVVYFWVSECLYWG